MEKEIKVRFQYRDIDGLQEVENTAYLLSESIYYEVSGDYFVFRELPIRERGKAEVMIYDEDQYRAFEIYCENAKTPISEMTAVQFIEKAKAFILSKTKQKQAFFDREHELKTKITELEAKRSGIIEAYNPTKGLDQAAIDKIDAEIGTIHKEIAVLNVGKTKAANYELEDLITHISEAKSEAKAVIASKLAEEEKVREKILAAKQALLKAQAEHYVLTCDANDYAADINDTLGELTRNVSLEISRLRDRAHGLSLELYRNAPDGSTPLAGLRSDQAMVDVLQEEYDKVRSETARLESVMGEVSAPISQLNSYVDENRRPIYLVDRSEQIDATQKGIVKE